VQLFAWLEANGLSGRDSYFSAGAWITSYAGFTGLDSKNAKASQLNAIAFAERLFHGLEDGINGSFCLDAGKPGAFNNSLDEILLDQWVAFLMS
jgi:hypothetical protein